MSVDVSGLLRTITDMQCRIALLERNARVNNIANASIEGGALVVNDSSGNTQITLGLQPDGTFAHVATASTAPEPPDAPSVTASPLGLTVAWDGSMIDGTTPLSDFAYVQVHVGTTTGFTPSNATLYATFNEASSVTLGNLGAGVLYYVTLIAVNVSGNASQPGPYASATTSAISGPHVAANAFGLNMIPDPQFTQAALNATRASDPASTGTWSFNAGTAICAATTGGSQLAYMSSASPPLWVSPGEQYYVSQTFTVTAACTLSATIQTDGGPAQVSQAVGGAGTYTLAGVVTIPAGATVGYFRVTAATGSSNAVTLSVPVCQPALLFSPTIEGTDWIISPTGEFYYSSTPAAGTLSVSVIPGSSSATDPFTNEALPGVTTYVVVGGVAYAVNQYLTNTTVYEGASQTAGYTSSVTANAISTHSVGGTLVSITQTLGGNIVSSGGSPTVPTAISTDSWNAATLAGSFTNAAGNALEYAMLTLAVTGTGTPNYAGMHGRITTPASAPGSPASITTLPAAYAPSRNEPVYVIENTGAGATGVAHYAEITTGGLVRVYGALTGSSTVSFQSIWPLSS